MLATRTRQFPLVPSRGFILQQLGQRCCPGLMHSRAHRHLDGFQIESSRLAPVAEDDTQQLVYFARDFLTDRFSRFFSWADSTDSCTGRKRQISSLTFRSWPPSSRKRWYSATSR